MLDRYAGAVDEGIPPDMQVDIDAGRIDFTDDGGLRADGMTKSWTWTEANGWQLEKDHAQS